MKAWVGLLPATWPQEELVGLVLKWRKFHNIVTHGLGVSDTARGEHLLINGTFNPLVKGIITM